LILQKLNIEESPLSYFIITVVQTFLEQQENALFEVGHFKSEGG